jgi:hypothetical protein
VASSRVTRAGRTPQASSRTSARRSTHYRPGGARGPEGTTDADLVVVLDPLRVGDGSSPEDRGHSRPWPSPTVNSASTSRTDPVDRTAVTSLERVLAHDLPERGDGTGKDSSGRPRAGRRCGPGGRRRPAWPAERRAASGVMRPVGEPSRARQRVVAPRSRRVDRRPRGPVPGQRGGRSPAWTTAAHAAGSQDQPLHSALRPDEATVCRRTLGVGGDPGGRRNGAAATAGGASERSHDAAPCYGHLAQTLAQALPSAPSADFL